MHVGGEDDERTCRCYITLSVNVTCHCIHFTTNSDRSKTIIVAPSPLTTEHSTQVASRWRWPVARVCRTCPVISRPSHLSCHRATTTHPHSGTRLATLPREKTRQTTRTKELIGKSLSRDHVSLCYINEMRSASQRKVSEDCGHR